MPPPLMEEMAGTEAALRPDRTSCSKGLGFGQPQSSVAPRAGAPERPRRRVCAGGPSAIVLRMNIHITQVGVVIVIARAISRNTHIIAFRLRQRCVSAS